MDRAVSTAFAAKKPPLPCFSIAFRGKTLPLPLVFPLPSRLSHCLCRVFPLPFASNPLPFFATLQGEAGWTTHTAGQHAAEVDVGHACVHDGKIFAYGGTGLWVRPFARLKR